MMANISHKFIIALLGISFLGLLLLPACGDDDETALPTEAPTSVPTVVPTAVPTAAPTTAPTDGLPAKPEGALTVAVQTIGVRPDLGPFTSGGTTERTWWAPVFDYLVYENRDQTSYLPGLAESWETSQDRMSITFKLRRGVQFHDGWGELTSADVKFTLDTAFDPQISKWKEAQTLLGSLVESVEAPEPYEVTIRLNRAMAEEVLHYVCPTRQLALGIVPQAYYEEVNFDQANKNIIGSGPYRLVEYEQGSRLELEAMEDHWRAVPEFKTIVFKEVPELMTRIAMFETGEADIAQVSAEQAAALQDDGIDIVTIPRSYYLTLHLLGQWLPSRDTYDADLPWLDKRVRQAMNLAINREEIAEYIYQGFASPIAEMKYTPWGDLMELYPYDPQQAKELLTQAGYPDGFDFEMWITTMPGALDMTDAMMAVAGFWEAIGLDVEIKQVNVMAVYGDILRRDTAGVCTGMLLQTLLAPYGRVFTLMTYSEATTFPVFESAETDEMIDEIVAAFTPEERDALLEQLNKHFYDEYTFVPIVGIDITWAKSDKLANWNPIGPSHLNFEYVTHVEPLGTFRLFEP